MSLDTWKSKRTPILRKLTTFVNKFNAYNKSLGIGTWEIQLEKLEPLYSEFDSIQNEIELLSLTEELPRHESEKRNEFETSYFEIVTSVRSFIQQQRASLSNSATSTSSRSDTERLSVDTHPEATVQSSSLNDLAHLLTMNAHISNLPNLTVPKFDGDCKDWVKFRDSFRNMVHEQTGLSNIQKFHYLNSALSGDAARVIQSLGVSETNYLLAWQKLLDRFEDSRSLLNYHMSALFDLPVFSKVTFTSLRQFIDDTSNNLAALNSLGENTQAWDTILIHLITTKLDVFTKRDWEKKLLSKKENPTFIEMLKFLEDHCKYLQRTSNDKSDFSQSNHSKGSSSKTNQSKFNNRVASHATIKKSCALCQESHALYNCKQFLEMSVEDRINTIRKLRNCYNCLTPGHHNRQCNATTCKKCQRKHNTLLHLDHYVRETKNENEQIISSTSPVETMNDQSSKTILVSHLAGSSNENVMLGTAIILIKDKHGSLHECRALLDSCSQVHLITRQLCERLNLPLSNSNTIVSGVFKSTQEPQYLTNVTINSRSTNYYEQIPCLVTSEITDNMPNIPLHQSDFEIPRGLELADPQFAKSRPIDMLIGAGIFWNLLCVGQIHLRKDQPILQKTKFGWIVAGPMQLPSRNRKLVCNLITNQQLHSDMQKFWEIETPFNERNQLNLDSKNEIEQHFISTTKRDTDGRFIASIPLKDTLNELGDSFKLAEKRLLAMEKRFTKDPELRKNYIDFMNDYAIQGHMKLIPANEIKVNRPVNYLPHHAVRKEGSTTTKVRVVFDGSAKTSSGLSFNEIQKVGPVVQSDLFSIVIRFRQHPIVLTADIAQMYRQIKIEEAQQDLQRILWRKEPSQPVQLYRLTTVTYGTAAAPYLATRALRQIGEENNDLFPAASKAIIEDFYVDDLLTGKTTVQEVRDLKSDLTQILARSGFLLRKWASNNPQVLDEPIHSTSGLPIQVEKDQKTLGLLWKPKSDKLHYQVNNFSQQRITKRTILSAIAQIFDPLGLVGPAIIRAKIILQKLWQQQLNWDESLPQDLHTQWVDFCHQLLSLNEVSVPRFVLCANFNELQLHGFCDASEVAYGACIYIRTVNSDNKCIIRLLCGKSRVAPLKKISLPRLELQAALLLSHLTESVCKSLQLKFQDKFFWSDSTITLCWINSSPSRWKTFVANRTSEIQELTNSNWNHVKSEDNPADLISRGINPEDLLNNRLWWNGPDWLSQLSHTWPRDETKGNSSNVPEEKKCEHVLLITTDRDFSVLERYSSLNKLVRVVAYCLRFVTNLKCKGEGRRNGYLFAIERQTSLSKLLKLAQAKDFQCETKEIVTSKQVSKRSKLYSLNPFIDSLGLLRVGGRLVNAPVPFEQKHPVILAANNPLTKLIITNEHERLLHAGCQTVMNSLRTQYWPLSCKNTVKGIIRKCVRCFRANPVTSEYLMGNLPTTRVSPSRPFVNCGVDYAGPYHIIEKLRSRSTTKVYACVFVCFATKAIHIELARDLSTEAFLNCLYRFTSRRGKCQHLYSDNGTNFVGARNELNEIGKLLIDCKLQESVTKYLTDQQITWHMIPPNAPNFGGLWEAAVKSMKKHLRRVIGDTRLMYEELYTVLTQVEACLNSRPLTPLSNDPNDISPLTPGHFLIGDSLMAVPQPDVKDIRQNRLNRYQHLQFMLQHFWQRWQREYLSQLQQRSKWNQSSSASLSTGSMVIIKDDNLPPLKWRLGRVTELHPGKDNITRVVSIKVADTIIKRPVSKICILPIGNDQN